MKKKLFFSPLMCFMLTNINAQFCNDDSCYKENACLQASQIKKQDYVFATVYNTYGSTPRAVDLVMTVYSPCILPVDINAQPGTE